MDADALRLLIREKLQDGRLPCDECSKVLGGPANGETCDACTDIVAKPALVMECIGEHYIRAHFFHVICFYIWDSERRTRGAEPPA
jgi:hypothetical protein